MPNTGLPVPPPPSPGAGGGGQTVARRAITGPPGDIEANRVKPPSCAPSSRWWGSAAVPVQRMPTTLRSTATMVPTTGSPGPGPDRAGDDGDESDGERESGHVQDLRPDGRKVRLRSVPAEAARRFPRPGGAAASAANRSAIVRAHVAARSAGGGGGRHLRCWRAGSRARRQRATGPRSWSTRSCAASPPPTCGASAPATPCSPRRWSTRRSSGWSRPAVSSSTAGSSSTPWPRS